MTVSGEVGSPEAGFDADPLLSSPVLFSSVITEAEASVSEAGFLAPIISLSMGFCFSEVPCEVAQLEQIRRLKSTNKRLSQVYDIGIQVLHSFLLKSPRCTAKQYKGRKGAHVGLLKAIAFHFLMSRRTTRKRPLFSKTRLEYVFVSTK